MIKVSNLIPVVFGMKGTALSSKHLTNYAIYKWLGLLIKLAISGFAMGYIFYKVHVAHELFDLYGVIDILLNHNMLWFSICAALLLSALNWFLEVLKWHNILNSQTRVPFSTSVKGVLSGVAIGVFSPNRIGEFVGRILALSHEKRITGTLLSIVNSAAQTAATFTFGIVALIYVIGLFGEVSMGYQATALVQVTLASALAIGLILYFRIGFVISGLRKFQVFRRFDMHLKVFKSVSTSMLLYLFSLSILRFFTFVAQYILMFYLLLQKPALLEVAGATCLTLFSVSLFPFVPVPDVLLRESFAIEYFQLFDIDMLNVSVAVFLVWLLNVAIPATIGAFTIFTHRIFRKFT